MTRGRVLAIVIALGLAATRSYWLPSLAPTWLRGASPFTWGETRIERARCDAWAQLMAAGPFDKRDYNEDPKAPGKVEIERTLRAGDSLAFEGKITRAGFVKYVFHCATANQRGHPGEHHTAASEPWVATAEEWPAIHALEERITKECLDSAVRYFPTSRFSKHVLMLRPPGFSGRLVSTAIDTVYDVAPRRFMCDAFVNGNGMLSVQVRDPNAKF